MVRVGRRALVQEDGHGSVDRNGEIHPPVAIDEPGGDEQSARPGREATLGPEPSIRSPQEDGHVGGPVVRSHQIRPPVGIEIVDGDCDRRKPGAEASLGREGSVGPAEEQGDVVGSAVGHRQVRCPVRVEVPDRHRERVPTGPDMHGGIEVSIPSTHEDREVAEGSREVLAGVGDDQIGSTVVVQISERDPVRRVPGGMTHGVGERPAAVTEVNREIPRLDVRHREVGLAVAVEIADGQREGAIPRSKARAQAECPVPVAEQDRNTAPVGVRVEVRVPGVGDREIAPRVAIEIARRDENRPVVGQGDAGLLSIGPVTVPEEDRESVGVIHHRHVAVPITIEIVECDGRRVGTAQAPGRAPEGGVAVSKEHEDVIGTIMGDDDVRLRVPVEITEEEGAWIVGHADRPPRREATVSLAEVDQHRGTVTVGGDEVLVPVGVEVGHAETEECRLDGTTEIEVLRLESPPAQPEED